MTDILKQYEEFLVKSSNASKNTLDSYRRDVALFLNYLEIASIRDYSQVDQKVLSDFEKQLESKNKSAATITRCFASIKSFYKFLMTEGKVSENPVLGLKAIKQEKKLPSILTSSEVDRLLSCPNAADPKGCRDKAMLELLYATGMRVSEMISLNVEDVHLQMAVVYCRNGKNERVIPLYKNAVLAVQDYLVRVRSVYAFGDNNSLFINLNGNRLTRQGFWKIIKQYASQLNLNVDITPHTLRHSFAAHLLENGASIKDIKDMLGHADISSTQVYAQIVKNRFKDVYNRCHPRA